MHGAMNKLTERLLAEGYTKENHPDYVEWSNWKDFEFTRAYLLQTVWETPCGLLKKGISSYNHSSYLGVDYCPENNNPRYGCPYYDELSCPHRFDTKLMGWNCQFHLTDKPYNYEQSVEKLWAEWDTLQSVAWGEIMKQFGYCACMEWDRPGRSYVPRFDVGKCIGMHCKNERCAITKLPRNLEKVNIFYDILRIRHYKSGLFEGTDQTLEKGVKKFDSLVARTDAEIWLRLNREIFEPKLTRDDRRDLFFCEMHGKTGFDDYDWCEYTVIPQNVRIERRETRDLMQDLQDVREGIEVFHASDIRKAAEQAKRDRRKARTEAKNRKSERHRLQNVNELINGDNEVLKAFAERELARLHHQKIEQISLFE